MTIADRVSADDVFINCPFDTAFAPLFRSLIFATYFCGFRPRSALEIDDSGQVRIEKLFAMIRECRFGIHDLSRTELDPVNQLPRFNMPLELGIFLGAKRYGNAGQKLKRALVLDVERYRYQKFISDLAGMDIRDHGNDPTRLVVEVRDWLANVSRRNLPSATKVTRSFEAFCDALPAITARLEIDVAAIPYVDFERIVVNWLVEASPVD